VAIASVDASRYKISALQRASVVTRKLLPPGAEAAVMVVIRSMSASQQSATGEHAGWIVPSSQFGFSSCICSKFAQKMQRHCDKYIGMLRQSAHVLACVQAR
jgi:hypothetical protein